MPSVAGWGVGHPSKQPPPPPRSLCLPRSWPAAAPIAQVPARRRRMTVPWSCSHPSPVAPVLASPRDTVAAAQAWPASLALPCGLHPVNAVVPAAAPHPRAAACPGWPLTGAVMVAAGGVVRRGPLGCLVPGPSHHLCLEALACCLPCAWRPSTLVVGVPGDLIKRPQPPVACPPVPRAGRGWRKGVWGPEGGWADGPTWPPLCPNLLQTHLCPSCCRSSFIRACHSVGQGWPTGVPQTQS